MSSFSVTRSESFTIINARKLASKVATDMHLCAQYYGNPTETRIREYAEELAQYLNAGYIQEYEFGYKKEGKRIVTWRYKVDANGQLTTDDRPGKIVPYVDIAGAVFFNFLTQNSNFFSSLRMDKPALKLGCRSRGRVGSYLLTALATGHLIAIIIPVVADSTASRSSRSHDGQQNRHL